jgi:hypothetical protein
VQSELTGKTGGATAIAEVCVRHLDPEFFHGAVTCPLAQ